jgi:carbon monoxide dehydrogenase subunit G
MRFENHFDVDAPIERVWDAVLDVERVAPTVPGAQVLERTGEDSYKVAIKVKVGPMSMTYRGEVEITERDEAAHRAVMKARAKESRGQGTANADVTMALSGADARTSATVTTDVELSGKVATMGQGVLQDVSGRLVQTFAQNLAAMLEAGEPQPAEVPARPAAEEAAGAEQPAAAAPAAPAAEARPAAGEGEGRTEVRPTAAAAGEGEARTEEPAEALDLGALGGEMLADRLRDPRALGGVLAVVALIAFLLGRRSAR